MGNGAQNDSARKPIDEVSAGSVTVPIYFAPVTIKVGKAAADGTGAPQGEFKTYDSFSIAYYEGSVRVQQRRNTLERARERAKEVAARLNRDGTRAEFITERDRRIYALAQLAAKPLGLEVDEVSRRYPFTWSAKSDMHGRIWVVTCSTCQSDQQYKNEVWRNPPAFNSTS